MKTKNRIILTSTLAILGLGMSGTGIYLELNQNPIYKVNVQKKYDVPIEQEFKITLKEIKLPINASLSMDIQSYIEEPVETNILKVLILDTTKVDTSKPGEYIYTITYQKQSFEGKILVEENITNENTEVVTTITKLTTKDISIKLGENIPQDVSVYIQEQITDEIKQQIKLDIKGVIINKPGLYQYTITYDGTIYKGNIKIEEDQKIETPKQPEEEIKNETEDNNENQSSTNETN